MTSESINSGELRQPESNLTIRRRKDLHVIAEDYVKGGELVACHERTGAKLWAQQRTDELPLREDNGSISVYGPFKIFTCMPSCWQLSPRAFVRASDHWEFFATERKLLSGCPLFRWKTAALKKDNFARFGDVKILLKIFNPIICKKFNCTCSRTWACRSEPWTSGLWEPAYDPCQRGQGGRARNIISDLSKISSQSF